MSILRNSCTKERFHHAYMFAGASGSGKTTLSAMITNAIHLDGDALRTIWTDLGLSKEDRWEQNLRTARLARVLRNQGHNVVVSTICPYRKLRKEVQAICDCKFIYISGGKFPTEEYPYEMPGDNGI